MLMTGITEAFDPDQLQRIFDTNASSWLRVNRAVLPVMRRQGHGTLVYTGSTTAHIPEPFLGPYAATKAAGDVLAEEIGRAHVWTPVNNAHLVCRLPLEKKKHSNTT